MQKTTSVLVLLPAIAAAQTCTVLDQSGCPAIGAPSGWTGAANPYAGPPTLKSFVTQASQVLPAAGNLGSNKPQPHIILTAQLTPAGEAYMTADSESCGGTANTGPPTCYFNQIGYAPDAQSPYTGSPAGILGYLYRLKAPPPAGVGLTQVDVNAWMGPLFVSSQYASLCGSNCYTPAGWTGNCSTAIGTAAWYCRGLATYDALFTYAARVGVKLDWAPEYTGDFLFGGGACGLTHGMTGSAYNYTETEVQSCIVPTVASAAARWPMNHMSVLHEPCGVMALVFGTGDHCFLDVSDVDTLITALSAAARANRSNSGMLIGAGAALGDIGTPPYTCPEGGNYWCDWVTNLAGSLDYYSVHAYPTPTPSLYLQDTLTDYGAMCAAVPNGKICLSDESSALRYGGDGSEGDTIFGCGSEEWLTDGSFSLWVDSVPAEWASATGLTQWSIFPSFPFIFLSLDPNNTHCSQSSDQYPQNTMAALAASTGVTAEGLAYAKAASGWTGSLQGAARLTGRAALGH
jgi:hypothetical protein